MTATVNNPFSKLLASYRKRGVFGVIRHAFLDASDAIGRRLTVMRDHSGKFQIEARSRNEQTLIVVLAGYKPAIWPLTLRRIAKYQSADAHVCVVTAGKHVPALAQLCEKHGWSYGWTALNKTGLVLNKAIAAHPGAKWIFKIDEDIFIAEHFFESMRQGYDAIESQGTYKPGFCSPMLNINGISYLTFLEKTESRSAYIAQFGEHRAACSGVHAHYDPAAALWLWRRTLPLDRIAAQIGNAAASGDAHLIPTRFSIGAVLFRKDYIDEIGGFRSSWREGILGVDESWLCHACMESSRPMFYLANVLAGHFSFYPQERAMLDALPELAALDPDTFAVDAP
ncbi:MAG TPA: hypothetical protein VIM98_08645 [Dyella sp.]|uniref:hypothetical protein n=1 Tax=Dyella sp. TaxID=1869338 RepID=UPI002F92BD86